MKAQANDTIPHTIVPATAAVVPMITEAEKLGLDSLAMIIADIILNVNTCNDAKEV